MNQPPDELGGESRAVVLQALAEVCGHRGWNLLAAPVRSNPVQVILETDALPERVMNDFKATRAEL